MAAKKNGERTVSQTDQTAVVAVLVRHLEEIRDRLDLVIKAAHASQGPLGGGVRGNVPRFLIGEGCKGDIPFPGRTQDE